MFRTFLLDTKGATAIEYALIAGIISIVVVTGATNIGLTLSGSYKAVATALR